MSDPRTGIVFDQRYLHHCIPGHSLENPARLQSLYLTLSLAGYTDRCKVVPARQADMEDILAVHSSFYLEQVREHAVTSDPYSYDKDTYLMEDTLVTAMLAAGGCMALADEIMARDIDQGFALVRPPGHHAGIGRGMGFCVLNNAAVTAEHLRRKHGLNRILIVDFDAHHGNGTQEIFYDTHEVMFLSVHQQDIFPFSGQANQTGEGKGDGYTINVPVYSQFGDNEYTYLFGHLLQTLCTQYLPQIILVSAGYDAHEDDSISQTCLTTQWYKEITMMLAFYAKNVCDKRLLMILEGGYNPDRLEPCVLTSLDGLLEKPPEQVEIPQAPRAERLLQDHPFRQFWTL
ncbi:MAG: histone deacetylase [Desulfobacterales bacterium]|nr:histone deacetylase [Desulfobacterales bacterium]